jgi:hypothetical protein
MKLSIKEKITLRKKIAGDIKIINGDNLPFKEKIALRKTIKANVKTLNGEEPKTDTILDDVGDPAFGARKDMHNLYYDKVKRAIINGKNLPMPNTEHLLKQDFSLYEIYDIYAIRKVSFNWPEYKKMLLDFLGGRAKIRDFERIQHILHDGRFYGENEFFRRENLNLDIVDKTFRERFSDKLQQNNFNDIYEYNNNLNAIYDKFLKEYKNKINDEKSPLSAKNFIKKFLAITSTNKRSTSYGIFFNAPYYLPIELAYKRLEFRDKDFRWAYVEALNYMDNLGDEDLEKIKYYIELTKNYKYIRNLSGGLYFSKKSKKSYKRNEIIRLNTQKHGLKILQEVDLLIEQAKNFRPKKADHTRVGIDYRNGKNIGSDDLLKEFKFRGIKFGNWVGKKHRQKTVNATFDALKDLAEIMDTDIEVKNLTLEFGASGIRGSMAHFSPSRKSINLNKKNGAGSLAHEFMHSIDNILCNKLVAHDNGNDYYIYPYNFSMLTKHSIGILLKSKNICVQKMGELMDKITDCKDLIRGSKNADLTKNKIYYTTKHELLARSFEAYSQFKLQSDNKTNGFLVQFLNNSDVYPKGEELLSLIKPMEEFFQAYKEMLQQEKIDKKNIENEVIDLKMNADEYRKIDNIINRDRQIIQYSLDSTNQEIKELANKIKTLRNKKADIKDQLDIWDLKNVRKHLY